jgi:lipoprotein-releasing system permease protein
MQTPLSVTIGVRYSRARKSSGLLSFVSTVAMLGVALGVTVLIVALAVMNGSIAFLRAEALKSLPHIVVTGNSVQSQLEPLRLAFAASDGIESVLVVTEFEALISQSGVNDFAEVRGIDAQFSEAIAGNQGARAQELLDRLQATPDGAIIDSRLAARLGLSGTQELNLTAIDSLLRQSDVQSQGFIVLGFADFGAYGGGQTVLINRAAALSLSGNRGQTKLQLTLVDLFESVNIASQIAELAPVKGDSELVIETWQQAQSGLFDALAMEKFLTGLMLMMIVMIGAVNIVSTLVMAVAEKTSDIAILRTMGASSGAIMRSFIMQGGVSGVLGTFFGAGLGVFIALFLAPIGLALESALGALLGQPNLLLVSHLQTKLLWSEVLLVCGLALLISLLATLYPAFRASRIAPAEVLRYE